MNRNRPMMVDGDRDPSVISIYTQILFNAKVTRIVPTTTFWMGAIFPGHINTSSKLKIRVCCFEIFLISLNCSFHPQSPSRVLNRPIDHVYVGPTPVSYNAHVIHTCHN